MGRHIRDLYQRDLYDLHVGRPMDRSKPSTASAGRQRSYAGLQGSLPADATAELQQMTIKWAWTTGGTMDRRHDTADGERPTLISEAADTFACASSHWCS